MSEVERMLRGALVPVDPPIDLGERMERRLTAMTDAAVDELADWDPSAFRDPRRWARIVVAGVVGAGAGGALVLVRAQQKRKRREARGFAALSKGLREVSGDARRRLNR
ncbi:MAG: hypothetical protein QOG63_1598 [Thermoleophilaceae bacterium]|jgi:hypothetical protein|nr:hypothetical protein [Thermoleophilaceae bacterium]